MEQPEVVVAFNNIRSQIKSLAKHLKDVKNMHNSTAVKPAPKEDRAEVLANLMLAYRHLEDASMRLGKAIQAYDGGVSVYDKATTVGA